ncbi:hypothetical protein TRVA0_006S00496 [Trichomonascus vanleenenianus]|uniref:uncharacterized protein n=1 Tax=Trichomonascus vanleenenianus TaxID=2268995 RepID=UPI003ECA1D46
MSTYEEDHNLSGSTTPRRENERQTFARRLADFMSFDAATGNMNVSGDQSELRQAADGMGALAQELVDILTSLMPGDGSLPPGFEEAPKQGMPQQFIDSLDRVPKKQLKSTDSCAICATNYLEDQYPLVVQLPCNKLHHFDLECIGPWLKVNSTCPMCRKDFSKRDPPVQLEDSEEEFDDMYG